MKRIMVSGSADGYSPEDAAKARELGQAIAASGCAIVSGACTGLPLEAARGAKQAGGYSVGVSPARNLAEHVEAFKYPAQEFDEMFFTGFGWALRNALTIRNSDAVLFVGGGVGTLQEFTLAFQEEKIIGVLEGTGGVSDGAREIVKAIGSSRYHPKIVFSSSPSELVEKVIAILEDGAAKP